MKIGTTINVSFLNFVHGFGLEKTALDGIPRYRRSACTITQCFYLHTLFIDFEIVYEVIFEVFEAEGCQWVKKQIFSVFL